MTTGIDVSYWQGDIDFAKVKKEIDFVVLRAGYRQQLDKKFLEYVKGCMDNKVQIKGVYWFVYAINVDEVIKNAEKCLEAIETAGLTKDITVWVDIEYDTVNDALKRGITLGVNEINNFTNVFCEFFQKRGYKTGVYMNLDYYNNKYSAETKARWPIWLADYSGVPDYACVMQQYTNKGKVDGINGYVDMNKEIASEEKLSTVEKAVRWMEERAR